MDWVHCNNCAGRPGQNKLYLSVCGHIFCQTCCGKAKDGQCYICKKPLKASEINKNLRPDLLEYFKDPMKLLSDACAEIRQVSAFQAKQREYYVKFRNAETKRETDDFNEARVAHLKASQEMEKRKKALLEEHERLKKEKERKKQLTERLHSLQRELHSRPQSTMPFTTRYTSQIRVSRTRTEPVPSKTARFGPPQNMVRRRSNEKRQPMPNGFLDQSTTIVTSTPIANIDFSRRAYLSRMFGAGMAHPSPIPRQ